MSKKFFEKMDKVFEKIMTSETKDQRKQRLMSNQRPDQKKKL